MTNNFRGYFFCCTLYIYSLLHICNFCFCSILSWQLANSVTLQLSRSTTNIHLSKLGNFNALQTATIMKFEVFNLYFEFTQWHWRRHCKLFRWILWLFDTAAAACWLYVTRCHSKLPYLCFNIIRRTVQLALVGNLCILNGFRTTFAGE